MGNCCFGARRFILATPDQELGLLKRQSMFVHTAVEHGPDRAREQKDQARKYRLRWGRRSVVSIHGNHNTCHDIYCQDKYNGCERGLSRRSLVVGNASFFDEVAKTTAGASAIANRYVERSRADHLSSCK